MKCIHVPEPGYKRCAKCRQKAREAKKRWKSKRKVSSRVPSTEATRIELTQGRNGKPTPESRQEVIRRVLAAMPSARLSDIQHHLASRYDIDLSCRWLSKLRKRYRRPTSSAGLGETGGACLRPRGRCRLLRSSALGTGSPDF
jgi:hypothetical protein